MFSYVTNLVNHSIPICNLITKKQIIKNEQNPLYRGTYPQSTKKTHTPYTKGIKLISHQKNFK